jgi:large subunit ribosomal protein L3
MPGILGKKLGMSQMITDEGNMVPVTYVVCEPNTVFQKKTKEKDGYEAVVLGFEPLKKPTKTKKYRILKEFSFDKDLNINDTIAVDIFENGELVTIRGVSKGKGFQGRVRRHNARVARRTHGTKYIRHGSTGNCTDPSRVKPGTKMPGRMGCDTVTLKGKTVLLVDTKRNLLAIKGPMPGAVNSLVIIEK